MIRIRKIELQGFKSFADRENIEIYDGITGIIGPNGMGKSNIIDAIRWCLGEQSYRTLRGESMEDVLFSGTDKGRKPSGMAEVKILFELLDPVLVEKNRGNSSLSISRILYRSGETEYLKNGKKSRLRDITEFLMEAGITSRSFSIIAQGEISEVATAKPETLRFYLDQAAGISKYRKKREETIKRIEKTSENLKRVKDIIVELTRQKNSLTRQAKKAERFKNVVFEERLYKYILFTLRIDRIRKLVEEKTKSLEVLEKELIRIKEEESSLRAEETLIANERSKISNDFDKLSEQAGERAAQIKEIELNLLKEEQLKREEIIKKTKLIERIEYLKRSIDEISEQLADDEKVAEEVRNNLEIYRNSYEETESKLKNYEEESKKINEAIEKAREDLYVISTSLAKKNNILESLKDELQELTTDQNLSAKELEKIEAEIESCRQSIESQHLLLKEWETKLENTQKELNSIIKEEREILVELGDVNQRIIEAEKVMTDLKARVEMARDFERSYLEEGIIDSYPRVGELISPIEGWETVVGAALGDRAKWIVVRDLRELEDILNNIDRKQISRIGVVVLNKNGVEKVKEDLNTLTGKINLEKEELKFMVNKIIVADNIKDAFEHFSVLQEGEGMEIVTLTGEKFWGGNFVEIIGEQDESIKFFNLREERINLENQLDSNSDLLAKLKEKREKLELKIKEMKNKRISLEAKSQDIAKNFQEEKTKYDEVNRMMEELKEKKEIVEDNIKNYVEKKEKIRGKMGELETELSELRVREEESKKQILNLENRKDKLDKEIEEIHKVLRNKRGEYERARERLSMIEKRMKDLKNKLDEDKRDLQENESIVNDIEERIKKSDDLIENLQKQKNEYEKEREILQGELSSLNFQQKEILNKLEQIRKKQTAVRDLMQTKNEELNNIKLKIVSLESDEKHISEELESVSDEEIRERAKEMFEENSFIEEEVQRQISELDEKRRKMGNINFAAVEELEEIKTRLEFAEKQRQDLEDSMKDLKDALVSIDEECIKRIQQTISDVNDNFSRIVAHFLKSAKGQVILQKPDDPINSGIEVKVNIPPSRVKNLNLLSGGQRSLISFSFLLALNEAKNTPVFIFDEVDAALDDKNIDKFIDLLRDAKSRSQIILITHNKKTIKSSDYLYGITMEEYGVSKVLSLKMEG